jgi:hypothetical protein
MQCARILLERQAGLLQLDSQLAAVALRCSPRVRTSHHFPCLHLSITVLPDGCLPCRLPACLLACFSCDHHPYAAKLVALIGVVFLLLPVSTKRCSDCSTGLALAGHPGSLILPAKHGHTAAVEALLEHGAELAPAGRADNAIMWSAKHPGTCMAIMAASRSLPQVGQLLLPCSCCPAPTRRWPQLACLS